MVEQHNIGRDFLYYLITALLMAVIMAFAVFLLYRQGLLRGAMPMVLSIVFLFGAFAIRFVLIDHITADYYHFLRPWVQHFRDNGGFWGLAIPVGNYNVPYLYFLALFSYFPFPDLYLIKLLSIFFDVLLAYYIMRIVGLVTQNARRQLFAFFTVLFLPTVVLNGAYWGQCDVIYGTFSVMGVYYALKSRPVLSLASAALAVAFKLQAVFLFPLYLLFLYARKIRLRHVPVFPLTYLLAILPAVLLGRPFLDTLLLYFNIASPEGRGLNYNSPSIFSFVHWTHVDPFLTRLGIVIAALFVLLVWFLVMGKKQRDISQGHFLVLALLFAVGVPLLLPQMHDRYFFLADVMAVCLAFVRLRYLPAIFLTQFASLLGYHAYLEGRFFLPMHYGAIALLLLTAVLLCDVIRQPKWLR